MKKSKEQRRKELTIEIEALEIRINLCLFQREYDEIYDKIVELGRELKLLGE